MLYNLRRRNKATTWRLAPIPPYPEWQLMSEIISNTIGNLQQIKYI